MFKDLLLAKLLGCFEIEVRISAISCVRAGRLCIAGGDGGGGSHCGLQVFRLHGVTQDSAPDSCTPAAPNPRAMIPLLLNDPFRGVEYQIFTLPVITVSKLQL